jgi:heptosyltransferase-2
LLTVLARIPRRVGFQGAPGSPFYTERVAAPASTFVGREAALARAVGAEPRPIRLAARPEWLRMADERLRGTTAVAALCIGSEWETKIWPAQHFADLADRLAERGLSPVLLGGPRDKPLAEAVQARAGALCIDTTGNPVGEALALLARSSLVVGGDTGLVHAARALGVPTIALFGPSSAAVHDLGPRERAVTLGLDCSPCSAHGQRRCPLGHHRCMRDLSAEAVLAHCESVLA